MDEREREREREREKERGERDYDVAGRREKWPLSGHGSKEDLQLDN